MKVFVVNMDKDTERREHSIRECSRRGLTPEIISAVNGRTLSEDELGNLVDPLLSQGLTSSEIGCSLSHLKIYNKMIEENIPLALVLEDDAQLDESIGEVLDYIERLNSNKPSVTILGEVRKYIKLGKGRINEKYSIVNVTQASLAHCYVINLDGARKLAHFLTPVWLEADRWTFFRECGIVDVKGIIPPVGHLSALSKKSTIWHTHDELQAKDEIRKIRAKTMRLIRKHRALHQKLKNALWRLFIRKLFEKESAQ